MRRFLVLVQWLLIICCSQTLPVWAEDWRNLVQPIGTVTVVETAATVNTRLGGNPPFDTATDVTTIQTSVAQYFVRFFNPSDPTYPSNPVGSWIMRAATVRGLTPTQVRDVFALPAMPTRMTMVLVPNGYNMYTGIAGPIDGWGNGGAQQSKLIGPPWVPSENFFNQQPIMSCVLCYRSMTTSSNSDRIATYLDRRIPAAYSDLETAYLNLDMLYINSSAEQFNHALEQIGPNRFGSLTMDALRIGVQYNRTVDQRVTDIFSVPERQAKPLLQVAGHIVLPLIEEGKGSSAWLQLAGSQHKGSYPDYRASAKGFFAGVDRRFKDFLAGVSFGFLHDNLDWSDYGGSINTDFIRLGLYLAWLPHDYFVQADINAGAAQSDASRRIAFSNLSRNATSHLKGLDANARIRAGYRLPITTLNVIPCASIDYFYHDRDSFTESGADSLNLHVSSTENRTLRTHLGMNISKDIQTTNNTAITPSLRVGWAREYPLDDRGIEASLGAQLDKFVVYGESRITDTMTGGLDIRLSAYKNLSIALHYTIEYRHDFLEQSLSAGLNYIF